MTKAPPKACRLEFQKHVREMLLRIYLGGSITGTSADVTSWALLSRDDGFDRDQRRY